MWHSFSDMLLLVALFCGASSQHYKPPLLRAVTFLCGCSTAFLVVATTPHTCCHSNDVKYSGGMQRFD